MTLDKVVLRPARAGDAQAAYDVTLASVSTLQAMHYPAAQLAIWMGTRTPAWHEALICSGTMIVAERDGRVVGFVHTLPGEINRLFVQPDAAGRGLRKRLLDIGIENARVGHQGPVKLASSLNAVSFYERSGFRVVARGCYPAEVADGRAELVKMELDP